MLKFIENMDKISDSNLFYLVEKKEDLKKLDFLKLPKNITSDFSSVVKAGKNEFKSYFLGEKKFTNLYVLFFLDKNKSDIYEILGEFILKLPQKFTIISNNEKNAFFLLESALLSRYKFQKYISEKKEDEIFLLCDKDVKKDLASRKEIIDIIIEARDMGETPTSDLYPEIFANKIKSYAWKSTKVKIFDPKKLEKEFGLIWSVGKGSKHKPYMAVFEKIQDKSYPTIGLVGKGICFDSGGINLKPERWLYLMKDDMCAAANLFGIFKVLDKYKLKVNVVGAIPLAENSIGGQAYRPSDILTSYSGKTVNVINTDAEGRLILADAISYISKKYSPKKLISIATLTGASLMALGYRYAGIMGDDRETIDYFTKNKDFEKYTDLPFDKYFVKKTKSTIADLDNLTEGVLAGPTMGAAFLYNFIENKEEFTHIDIAGVANNTYEPYGLFAKATTGFGIDSISKFLINYGK